MNRIAPELVDLTSLCCDEDLSPDQAARLEALVAESADARQYVLDSFLIHNELAWEFHRDSAVPAKTRAGDAPGGLGTAGRAIRPLTRWPAVVAAAAVLLALAMGVAITLRRRPRDNSSSSPAIAQVEQDVARIARMEGVQWRGDTAAAAAVALPAGRKLSIERGLLQVRFQCGASILLRGPAEIELQSSRAAELRGGSLTADVPAEARGFAVHTPNAALIDLGTRFGVACQAEQTDVEVFAGKVLVRPDSPQGAREIRLSAGSAARVSGVPGVVPLKIEPIAPGSRVYVQSTGRQWQPMAPAYACPEIPQAAAELIGPWHSPLGPMTPIDLSRQANWGNEQSTPDRVANNLKELAPGPHILAGVEFQVAKRLIQLHGFGVPKQPLEVVGIPVDRRVAKLYILQGAQFARPEYGVHEGELIAEYRVRYADGDRATIPVAIGQDVRDWWALDLSPVARGQVAWVGSNPEVKAAKKYLRLYLCAWANPHPEKTVERIDFVALHKSAAPFCVAITAEEPRQ